jgi:hypothetical protein
MPTPQSPPRISIDNIANAFSLPDLRATFADYYCRDGPSFHDLHTFGHPRRAAWDAPLCFNDVEVWHKVRVQQKSFHDPSIVRQTFTINASPPTGRWKWGRYDTAIFTVDNYQNWPRSGLKGV